MKTVDISKAAADLAVYVRDLNMASSEPVLITESGKPVAALVGVGGIDLESISLSSNSAFLELIERSRARHAKEGGISSADVRRRFAKASANAKPSKKIRGKKMS